MSAFKEYDGITVYNFSGFVNELEEVLNERWFDVDDIGANEMFNMLLAVVHQMNFTLKEGNKTKIHLRRESKA